MSALLKFFRRNRAESGPAEMAVYWMARRRLGTLSSADAQRFQRWLADPTCRAEYDALEAVSERVGAFAADAELRKMRAEALATPPPARRLHQRPFALAAVAAAMAAIVVVDVAGHRLLELTATPKSAAVAVRAQAPIRYTTGIGETRVLTLDDGSVVTLNTATVLVVDFASDERDVRLIAGQAMFQVAKDANRPFVVAAGDRRITAVGTAFEVRVDTDRVAVVLVEGRIVVDPLKPKGLVRVLPELDRYNLTAGEQLIASPDAPVAVANADTERATSWRQGQLIFRNDTVAVAIAEMNRYSTSQLIVDDPEIAALRISGVFKTTHPENFIAAITSSYPIETDKRSPSVTALVRRK
jgi:transmembrane sensor